MKDRLRTKAIFQVSKVLWHLDIFRRSFRELSGHTCMLDSCIFCALKELFSQLQFSHESALPPDALRRALAESFFDQQRFQLGFMDDAAECFENILLRIHFHLACSEVEDLCSAGHCIPHVKFAMTLVEQSVCGACGATSEPLPFTQMVHYVSASALISQAKQAPVPNHPDLFGQLLKKAGGMGDIRDCPSACGAKIQIRRTLTNQPEIVSVGIVWDSERPSLEQVMSLLGTLRTSLRLSEVFHTPSPASASACPHQLVGVVTYYGKHYSTFFFHTKLKVWIYFDDANVREVGPKWEQVVDKCRRGRYQPLLLLFASPDGSPIDPSTAPKLTTVAPAAKPPLGRRSLTPSPEKPSMGGVAQRRAVTPNPEQNHEPSHTQRPLQVLSEYQNLAVLAKAGMWGRKDLVRRDSGNWSGDRNSASSSSSTSLENPYQYILGKVQKRTHVVPRSPTSLKGGESSSGGSCDPGYDSYSLSSTDSLPLQQTLKHNLQLAQIPEGHQSPASLVNLQFLQKNGLSECERLCDEADILLKHSQATDDLEKALSYANAAVGKARQAMDAPYSNPQAATAARMKHSTCIMQARSIHKRIEEPNGPRHGEGRHSREGSGCSGRGSTGSHSRQGSKDKGNHSRQNSKELLPDLKPPSEAPIKSREETTPEKNIEIYATLPKTKKGLLSRATSKIKNTIEDEEYLMYDRPGRSLARNKPPNGKKDEKRARSEERNNKTQKEKEFISNQIAKEAKKQIKAEEQKQGKKQHKVRRKLLMGGLIRRKNRSMPDLREDEVPIKGVSKDDSNVGKVEKQPSLSGYLSEGHLEYSGNPNLERSRLMRKSLHGSKLIQMAKVPPPPPLRTTSQLSKDKQFQMTENMKENKLSLWKEPEPQSLPHYSSYMENPEAVLYANGGYLINNCQTKLVTTAQVHQVASPDKEYKSNENDEDAFDLPPYPSPLNSVSHSRQASEDFPPPPNELNELGSLSTNSLLEQLQRKRQQILIDQNFLREMHEGDQAKLNRETWLSELQAKQAALRNRDLIETDISFPHAQQEKLPLQEIRSHPDAISADIGKRLDDQISTVRDLKSKFETISLKSTDKPIKTTDILPEKTKISSLTSRDSPVINHNEIKHDCENSIKVIDGEIKSSLANGGARCDDIKKKPKKKNVTFCEQVVLVATAEEDKVNSYIPNPILERVLRSVLHRDSHQETKEIAVHSVVPLKRNDSGNYGQCGARNQAETKDISPDETDSSAITSDHIDKNVGLPQSDKISVDCSNSNGSRPYGFQRMLPSPVPNRQQNRNQPQPQMSSMNQNPYQPVTGIVSPNMQLSNSVSNGNEQVLNSNSPYLPMNAIQYHADDQHQLTRGNYLSQSNIRDPRQFPETDLNKLNQYNGQIQAMSLSRGDFNNSVRDIELRGNSHENPEFNQNGLPNEPTHLYNSNNSQQVSNMQLNNIHSLQHNSGPMSLPTSQNFSQYPNHGTNYNHSNMVPSMNLIQPKTQVLSHQVPSNTNQAYQQLPPSVAQLHQQRLAHQQQLMNSNSQLANSSHLSTIRQQQMVNPQAHPTYQSPPVMQQRNLPSPNFHNQPLQNASHSQGVLTPTQNGHLQLQTMQQYQRNPNHHLSNGNPHQIKSSPLSPTHHEQPTYLSSLPQHHLTNMQNQQLSNQLPTYPSHAQVNNQAVTSAQQSANMNINPNQSNNTPSMPVLNQQGSHSSNMPSPSPSIKSQMMLNHSQMSLLQVNSQQPVQMLQQNGQSSYMTLPQKMRQPLSNGVAAQVQGKGRPQGMYQPESPIQEYPQQHMIKKEVPNLRTDIYQRVPNLLHPENYPNPAQYSNGPLSPQYQSPTGPHGQIQSPTGPHGQIQSPTGPHGQIQSPNGQQIPHPLNSNDQALTVKYSPYQHPPLPRQIVVDNQKVQSLSVSSNGRTSMCNLCRKKQIVPPSIYCADCDFYMSRFKPRT